MAGIPDICVKDKDYKKTYEEVYFDKKSDKVIEIKHALEFITERLSKINCYIIYVPITTMNIEKWNYHRLYKNKTKFLRHTENYMKMQDNLNWAVHQINIYIISHNKTSELATPLIQAYVHKSTGSKKRYAYAKLVDGVHPSEQLIQSWVKHIQKTMSENESRLQM